jgi:hypothetical protein
MAVTLQQARAAKGAAKKALAALPGVVGVGITKIGEDYALKVNLSAPLPKGVTAPERMGDVPVRFEVVGAIRKRE